MSMRHRNINGTGIRGLPGACTGETVRASEQRALNDAYSAVPRSAHSRETCRAMRPRRGVALLEVIISLGLLVFGMAAVGYQINTSLSLASATDMRTRGLMLVESKMAELDAGVLAPSWIGGEDVRGHFGITYPGYTWRMHVKPAEIPNLYLVMLEIGYNEARGKDQIESPELDIEIEDPGTQIIRTAYRLVPKPADVNFQRDFGLSQEEMDELIAAAAEVDPNAAADAAAGASGGGGGGGGGAAGSGDGGGNGGGGGGDPVMAMIQQLIQAVVSGGLDPSSINPRDLAQYLDDETLDKLGPFIDLYFGNGLDRFPLPGPLQNPLMQQVLGGGRGGRGRGGRRGGPDRGGDRADNPNDASDQGPGGRRPGRDGGRPDRGDGPNTDDNNPPGNNDGGPGGGPGRGRGRGPGGRDNGGGAGGGNNTGNPGNNAGDNNSDNGGGFNRGGRPGGPGNDGGFNRGGRPGGGQGGQGGFGNRGRGGGQGGGGQGGQNNGGGSRNDERGGNR